MSLFTNILRLRLVKQMKLAFDLNRDQPVDLILYHSRSRAQLNKITDCTPNIGIVAMNQQGITYVQIFQRIDTCE